MSFDGCGVDRCPAFAQIGGQGDQGICNRILEGSIAARACEVLRTHRFRLIFLAAGREDPEEILDAWGNPIVYITKNHYGETVKITKEDGTEVEVEAVKGPSGAYYNATSYQVISLGKNGVQDLDSDVTDDIENFTREE